MVNPSQKPSLAMTVRIYQPAKSTTQSGQGKAKGWSLDFEPEAAKSADPLMGWVSSADTQQQLRLHFPTEAAAIAYATSKGLDYVVVPVATRVLKLQSYADNFR
jgi:ETC complex I subunit conserved region